MDRMPTEALGYPRAPVPFVVGSARSGTTLVRAMLDAHSDLAVPGESHFIPRLRLWRRRYEHRSRFDIARFCADLVDDRYFAAWGLPAGALMASLQQYRPLTVEAAIRETFFCYARRHRKRRWGDKTPAYVVHMPVIAAMFPEARFVHIIRDGRDVSRSLLELGWATSIEDAGLRWAYRVRLGRSAGRMLGERYLEIRYEDLVADSTAALRRICSFVGLSLEEGMTRPDQRAAAVLATLRNPENHQRLHLPPTRLRDWRDELTLDQVGRFEAVAGDVLEEAGYERAAPRSPFVTRISIKSKTLTSMPRRLTGRLRR